MRNGTDEAAIPTNSVETDKRPHPPALVDPLVQTVTLRIAAYRGDYVLVTSYP